MNKCWQIFMRTPVLVALFFLWLPYSAAAECGDFKPLDDLTRAMQTVAAGQVPSGAETAQRVAKYARAVEFDEVRRRLQHMDLASQFSHVQRLKTHATEYSRTMRVPDPGALVINLRYMGYLFAVICPSGQRNGAVFRPSEAGRNIFLTSILGGDSQTLRVVLLLLALSGNVGLLFLLRYCVRYLIGLLHHRKTCRMAAQICGDGHEFPGVVTRAGLDGVRFEFDSDATAKRLTDLMASPKFVHFDLRIGDKIWPVFVDGFHKFFAPLYFLDRIDRTTLDGILAQSTRIPTNAPSIGHKSTRKKWRAQIQQRKASVLNVKRQRLGPG